MVFLGIYRAIYDYAPQAENELAIQEGDLLFVLEKSTDDDWWRAKKKALNEEEEEPEGLIPNNYVEEATSTHKAKALYDYTRQTDEELSFSEETVLDVYDTSDPDWTLVGLDGEYGFAPSNYIEVLESAPPTPARPKAASAQNEIHQPPTPVSPGSPAQSPAAAIAGIIQQKTGPSSPPANHSQTSSAKAQYTPEESEDEREAHAPSLPRRPPSETASPPLRQQTSPPLPQSRPSLPSPPPTRSVAFQEEEEDTSQRSPGGFHLYNIYEMVSHAGKNKKLPMVLGINIARGIIMIAPEKSRDGPSREWTAEKLTHYSIEGKHVFMELVRPSKSVDFHAGAKDTAEEIVAALGELAGGARAGGLREVLAASAGSSAQKKGHMLYDFMAQGDDEVTVAVDDEVVVLDDTKSDEWWMVRRLKNGKEGVVPSSYVEVTGIVSPPPTPATAANAGRSVVEQNRLDEERLARQASKGHKRREGNGSKGAEVGPGLQLPQRNSSLLQGDNNSQRPTQRSKRESREGKAPATAKPKPDPSKIRTWTDRSGSFKVDAEFIGLADGKIHLHKLNGVKIAVPVPKMAIEDLEYVERVTGVSLDEDKPLSDIKRRSTQRDKERRVGASIEKPKKPEYDWFDFFLQCGVNPQICERYASSFAKDEMSEESLPDVEPALLRTLGLKEGDILRVMKFLDNKFNRTAIAREKRNVSFGGASVLGDGGAEGAEGAAGGLFSGPGGALRNNTRKGRPAPAVQTNDLVDARAFEIKVNSPSKKSSQAEAASNTPTTAQASEKEVTSPGFDDNAWEPKPSKQPAVTGGTSTAPASTPTQAITTQQPTLPGSLAELSLLSPPLQPTPAPQLPQPAAQSQTSQPPMLQQQQPAPTGANPSLFDAVARSTKALQQQQQQPQPIMQQPTGFLQPLPQMPTQLQSQQQQFQPPRQRPQPPQQLPNQNPLLAPPPPRSLSAPQNFPQQSAFGPPPLQPQLTGYQNPNPAQAQYSLQAQNLQNPSQQQYQASAMGALPLQPQQTGFGPPPAGYAQFQNGFGPQPTGFGQLPPQQVPMQQLGPAQFQQPQPTGFQPAMQQQLMNGQQLGSPFADPPRQPFQPMASQPTGMQSSYSLGPQIMPQRTGINAFLPPPLQPQPTGANGFGNPALGLSPPPVPSIPQQPTIAPLLPQKTGPPPPVRFGVSGAAKKLAPQPTGRRANLSQATPQNPFGF